MTRLAIGAAGAALVILLLGIFHFHQISAAREAGIRDERLVWQQRQAVAEAKAEEDRKAAQAEISRIETEFWKRSTSDREIIADLEEALADEKQDDEKQDDAAVSGPCAVPPVSKRVRDNLNRLGRD